jgi:hypothetical protein
VSDDEYPRMPRLPRGGLIAWLVCVVGVVIGGYGDSSGHKLVSGLGIGIFLCGFVVFAYYVMRTMKRWLGPNWWRGGGGPRE